MNPMQRLLVRLGLDGALRKQAERIAAECSEGVAARLTGNTVLYTVSEARGYVRARAAVSIRRKVAEVKGLTADCRKQLCDLIAGQLADRFASQLVQRPMQFEYRRAA